MSSPAVYNHVRPVDVDYPAGIYRVVGTSDTAVTLLRVADAGGRRIHTGKLVTVSDDEFDGVEPAQNPDGNRPFWAVLTSKLEMTYWSVRVFAQQLATQPLPTTIALTVLLAGSIGDQIVQLPDVVFGGLLIAGSLGLAYVGRGRL